MILRFERKAGKDCRHAYSERLGYFANQRGEGSESGNKQPFKNVVFAEKLTQNVDFNGGIKSSVNNFISARVGENKLAFIAVFIKFIQE